MPKGFLNTLIKQESTKHVKISQNYCYSVNILSHVHVPNTFFLRECSSNTKTDFLNQVRN